MSAHTWWILGAVNGLISVAAGAFGAHGLKGRLSPDMLAVFETGARYQMYHALALLAVAWLVSQSTSKAANGTGWCFLVGIILFSGSLYALSLTGISKLGIITPFGGTLFLAGWVLLAVAGVHLSRGQ